MSAPSKTFIPVSGKTSDIAFLAALLRTRKIPFSQAAAFAHAPILKIPSEQAVTLDAILLEIHDLHPVSIISAEELSEAQNMFWVMVAAAAGILAIAWIRYFIRRLH